MCTACVAARASPMMSRNSVAQLLRRLEEAVGVEVRLPEAVHRARDVARRPDRSAPFTPLKRSALRASMSVAVGRLRKWSTNAASTVAPSIGLRDERARSAAAAGPSAIGRPSFFHCGNCAVEQRHLVVPEPAQHPPQAHRPVAAHVVVDHDLAAGRDAAAVHLLREDVEVGQRMPAVLARLRSGEVVVDVHEVRVGNVALGVDLRSAVRVHQVVARVDHDPVGVVQVPRQLLRRNQHLRHVSPRIPLPRSVPSSPPASRCSPLATMTAMPAHSSARERVVPDR